jgi:hypothetical protein
LLTEVFEAADRKGPAGTTEDYSEHSLDRRGCRSAKTNWGLESVSDSWRPRG